MSLTEKDQRKLDEWIVRSYKDFPHMNFGDRLRAATDLAGQFNKPCPRHGSFKGSRCRKCYLSNYAKIWTKKKIDEGAYTVCRKHGLRKTIGGVCSACLTKNQKHCPEHGFYVARGGCKKCYNRNWRKANRKYKWIWCDKHKGWTKPKWGVCQRCKHK